MWSWQKRDAYPSPLHCFVGSSHRFEANNVQAAKDEAHERADEGHEGRTLNKRRPGSPELKNVVNGSEEEDGDDVEGVPFFDGGVDKVAP